MYLTLTTESGVTFCENKPQYLSGIPDTFRAYNLFYWHVFWEKQGYAPKK